MNTNLQDTASLADFERLPNSANVRLPVVQALFACSDETIRRYVKAGRIPAPRKLGPRITAWNVGELRLALAGPPAGNPAPKDRWVWVPD